MEKLRLGVCDDEAQDLAQVLEMVKHYDVDCQLQITTFLHAKDLLYAKKTVFIQAAYLSLYSFYLTSLASYRLTFLVKICDFQS